MTEPTIRIEMVGVERILMDEIADPKMSRDDIAASYAHGLVGSEKVDWSRVNHAILDRWSMAALRHIKERAHRLATGRN